MSRTQWKLAFFTLPEYEDEQDWLREQHLQGRKLTGVVAPCFYRFEPCEPEDVVYQLDYNPEGMAHPGEYIRLFADCGWEYVAKMVGYSYFRKPAAKMQGDEEIFCDDESRLAMLKRVFRGKMIPLLVLFFCCILPQLFLQYHLGDGLNRFLFGVYVLLLLLYIVVFFKFGRQYWSLWHKAGR